MFPDTARPAVIKFRAVPFGSGICRQPLVVSWDAFGVFWWAACQARRVFRTAFLVLPFGEVTNVKKSTQKESRGVGNLWGLKPGKASTQHSAAPRRARKQPPRGFGARTATQQKDNGVLSKILRALKLKK